MKRYSMRMVTDSLTGSDWVGLADASGRCQSEDDRL